MNVFATEGERLPEVVGELVEGDLAVPAVDDEAAELVLHPLQRDPGPRRASRPSARPRRGRQPQPHADAYPDPHRRHHHVLPLHAGRPTEPGLPPTAMRTNVELASPPPRTARGVCTRVAKRDWRDQRGTDDDDDSIWLIMDGFGDMDGRGSGRGWRKCRASLLVAGVFVQRCAGFSYVLGCLAAGGAMGAGHAAAYVCSVQCAGVYERRR